MNKNFVKDLAKEAYQVYLGLDEHSTELNYHGVTVEVEKGKENRFSSDTATITYDGRCGKLAHEVCHAVDFILNGHESRHIDNDSEYLNDDSEIAALICECIPNTDNLKAVIPALYTTGVNVNDFLGVLEEVSPHSYKLFMKDEKPTGEDIFYCEDLAKDDPWLGDRWTYYISTDTCSECEWKDAGLDYLSDAKDNGEIDEDDYEEGVEYYKFFDASDLYANY